MVGPDIFCTEGPWLQDAITTVEISKKRRVSEDEKRNKMKAY